MTDVGENLSRLRDLARQGRIAFQIELGYGLLSGRDLDGLPIPIDFEEARYWLKIAHDQGASIATFVLGTIYEKGLGVEVDLSKAIELYGQAAAHGSYDAKLHLARIFSTRESGKYSLVLAIEWYGKVLDDSDVDEKDRREAQAFLAGAQ